MRTVVTLPQSKILALAYKFDGDFLIDGQPLLLEPDAPTTPTKETGYRVWDCGIVLAKQIEATYSPTACRGLRVLELGCGTGVAGFSMALKGAAVTLTDKAAVADRTAVNVERNRAAVAAVGGSVKFEVLDWNRLGDWQSTEQFDVILAADCVWHESHVEPFTRALQHVCRHGSAHVHALMAHKRRYEPVGEPFFAHLRKNGFEYQQVRRAVDDGVTDLVDIWMVRPVAGDGWLGSAR
eukprot:GGOE01014155.1.p1 GENE.GGOE01014155.1~~GGOE01014155.1.p1  ORF type:complete len:238 (+),score=48.55 GGOE01014155.1:58-771(+)